MLIFDIVCVCMCVWLCLSTPTRTRGLRVCAFVANCLQGIDRALDFFAHKIP